jgi:hypothetical protein
MEWVMDLFPYCELMVPAYGNCEPLVSRLIRMNHKKTDVVDHLKVIDHVGLLVSRPPGTAGLPFS